MQEATQEKEEEEEGYQVRTSCDLVGIDRYT